MAGWVLRNQIQNSTDEAPCLRDPELQEQDKMEATETQETEYKVKATVAVVKEGHGQTLRIEI